MGGLKLYPNKYRNFHDCKLKVRNVKRQPVRDCQGVVLDSRKIFETSARQLNFKVVKIEMSFRF